MQEIDRILDDLRRGFDGDAWHGDPLLKIVGGVDARTAARRPLEHGHTIWELVLHITGWKREVAGRMRGNPAGEPAEGDWPAAPSGPSANEAAWRDAIEGLKTAQKDLLDAVRSLAAERLHAPVSDPRSRELGTGMTHAQTLHGILQHDAYHAGQISLLKKA